MQYIADGNIQAAKEATAQAIKAKADIIGASVALEAGGNLAATKAKADSSLYSSRLVPVHNTTVLAALTVATIDIQPSAGETWMIYICASLGVNTSAGGQIVAGNWDGATWYGATVVNHAESFLNLNNTVPVLSVAVWLRITNANYARIQFYNATTNDAYRKYTYFGWKE